MVVTKAFPDPNVTFPQFSQALVWASADVRHGWMDELTQNFMFSESQQKIHPIRRVVKNAFGSL